MKSLMMWSQQAAKLFHQKNKLRRFWARTKLCSLFMGQLRSQQMKILRVLSIRFTLYNANLLLLIFHQSNLKESNFQILCLTYISMGSQLVDLMELINLLKAKISKQALYSANSLLLSVLKIC